MRIASLEESRIAILGAGREGQAAYSWLRSRLPGKSLTVIAEAPADPAFLDRIQPGDRLLVEPLSTERLRSFDVLVRSPGISPYREPLRAALAAGVRMTTPSNLWFAAHPDARTICITGTKGKSTTSALMAHLLQSCGHKVKLAGNIGLPLLACDEQDVDWWVVELSSYQIADLEAKPTIAVILNFSPEHLDWHGSEAVYRQDKFRLAALAGRQPLILNASDRELSAHFAAAANVTWFNSSTGVHVVGKSLFEDDTALPVNMPPGLPGLHNLVNAAAALTAARSAGLDLRQAAGAIADFKSLPHRLQVLGQSNAVTFINDSIASTPVATVAALESLGDRPVILIVGGLDRGLDWSRYASAFLDRPPKALIGVPANGPRIMETLRQEGLSPDRGFHEAADLQAAVALAKELAVAGDTVLLSPGAPSFPHFADFRDRGQAFARLCGFEKITEWPLS